MLKFMLRSEAWWNTKDMCRSPLNYKGDFLFYSPSLKAKYEVVEMH